MPYELQQRNLKDRRVCKRQMSDCLNFVKNTFSESNILFALLDDEEQTLRILASSEKKKDIAMAMQKKGIKKLKDKSKDLYLYGMDHFDYYEINGVKLTVCYQLACRSTLNGEWIPLDRKINNYVMDRIVETNEKGIFTPMPEDYLCYLLAKGVYTQKCFSDYDIKRIEEVREKVDNSILTPKIDGVFFRFSDTILKMTKDNAYEDIVDALMRYSDY